MSKPVLLLTWLEPSESNEAKAAYDQYREFFDIEFVFSGKGDPGKQMFEDGILSWGEGNDNAQFLYIGTHGSPKDIGPQSDPGATWEELWRWLLAGQKTMKPRSTSLTVIFGACFSSSAADSWTPMLEGSLTLPPVYEIVSFDGSPDESEVEILLNSLMKECKDLNTRSTETWLSEVQLSIETKIVLHRFNSRDPMAYAEVPLQDVLP